VPWTKQWQAEDDDVIKVICVINAVCLTMRCQGPSAYAALAMYEGLRQLEMGKKKLVLPDAQLENRRTRWRDLAERMYAAGCCPWYTESIAFEAEWDFVPRLEAREDPLPAADVRLVPPDPKLAMTFPGLTELGTGNWGAVFKYVLMRYSIHRLVSR
jgi:hypothetical protein